MDSNIDLASCPLNESLTWKQKNLTKKERWQELVWRRDYDELVWRPVEKLEKHGGEEALFQAWNIQREYAARDLWFLCYFVLDYNDIGNPHHIQVAEWVEEIDPFHWDGYHRLFLMPRDHLKTCEITIGGCTRLIINYPWIRIPLGSGRVEDAVTQYQKFKVLYENNTYLQWLYPDVFYKDPRRECAERWAENKLKVRRAPGTDARLYQAEPTLWAFGLEGVPTGPHFDMTWFEDAECKENSETDAMVQKTKKSIGDVLFTLERNKPAVFIGTPHSHNGFHIETVRRWRDAQRRGVRQHFKVYVRKIKYGEEEDWPIPEGAKIGDYIFPKTKYCNGWDDEVFESRKALFAHDWKQFASQYLMEPIAPGTTRFDLMDLRYYQVLSRKGDDYTMKLYAKHRDGRVFDERTVTMPLNFYVLMDLAVTQNKRSDFTAIVPVGVGPHDEWFVFPYIRKRLRPIDAVQQAAELIVKKDEFALPHPVKKFGYEREHIGWAMTDFIVPTMRTQCPGVAIVAIPAKQPYKDKKDKIESRLGPKANVHALYIREDMYDFENEWAVFPLETGTDDIIDATSNIAWLRELPKVAEPETEQQRKGRECVEYWKHAARSMEDVAPHPDLAVTETKIPGYW